MNIVKARTPHNKMEVKDTRCFAIDVIKLLPQGILFEFIDLLRGYKTILAYGSLEDFNAEWEICKTTNDVTNQFKSIINEYQ